MENTLSAFNDKESMHHDLYFDLDLLLTASKVLMKKALQDKKAWEYQTNQVF